MRKVSEITSLLIFKQIQLNVSKASRQMLLIYFVLLFFLMCKKLVLFQKLCCVHNAMKFRTKDTAFVHKIYSFLFPPISTSPLLFLSFRTEEGKCRPSLSGIHQPGTQPAAEGDSACPLPRASAQSKPDNSLSHSDKHGPSRKPYHSTDS